MSMLHGGDLVSASEHFKVSLDNWLDLSTGISPWSWPVPQTPDSIWQRLPYIDNALELQAGTYYECETDCLIAAPGTQFLIGCLPDLCSAGSVNKTGGLSVALPVCGYREHWHAWKRTGCQIRNYHDDMELLALVESQQVDHAVVINPNNPTTKLNEPELLLHLAGLLSQRHGHLIVDEAFIDATPGFSLTFRLPTPGLLILRSLGKFFGLAGIRLGFLLAAPDIIQRMTLLLPLWSVSGPARWVGRLTLADHAWQHQQRGRLTQASEEWFALLTDCFPELMLQKCPLFVTGTAPPDVCQRLFSQLANRGILTRCFTPDEGVSAIRFGLPNEQGREEFIHRIERFQ